MNRKIFLLGAILASLLVMGVCLIGNKKIVNDAPFVIRSQKAAMDVLQIDSVEDWIDFAETTRCGNDYLGKTVYLNTDLEYDDILYSEYGEQKSIEPTGFRGVFNGQGHTIHNITIISSYNSGLFAKLQGVVANLQIVGGVVQGEYAGALAAELDGGALINCCAYVDIVGNTVDGLYGYGEGDIDNCVTNYNYTLFNATGLNQSIPGINERNRIAVNSFSMWNMESDRPCLSKEVAPVDIVFELNDEQTVEVIYSDAKERYICPIPSGFEPAYPDMRIKFIYPDREEEYTPAFIDGAYWFDWGGNIYEVEYMETGDVPSMFLSLSDVMAYEWMRYSRDTYFTGEYKLYDENGRIDCLGGVEDAASRGHHSFTRGTKPGLKLNLANAADMLGMGSDRHWVLLPAERDDCFLTYVINHDLGNAVGMEITPKQKPVQVFVNEKYIGLYILSERIEIDNNRFHLSDRIKLNGERSFLVEIYNRDNDGEEPKHPLLWSDNQRYMLRYPREATKLQFERIAEYLSLAENAIKLNGKADIYGKTYGDYIDVDSFAKQWLMLNFAKEGSIYSSLYYYRDMGANADNKLHAIRPWDVEHSYMTSIQNIDYDVNTSYFIKELEKNKDFLTHALVLWEDRFLPAMTASLNPETGYVENGLSSIDYYVERYRIANALDNVIAKNDIEFKADEFRTYFGKYAGEMTDKLEDMIDRLQ